MVSAEAPKGEPAVKVPDDVGIPGRPDHEGPGCAPSREREDAQGRGY